MQQRHPESWGGNMDIQPVIDDVAAVMYVCSYVTKGEKQ